MAGNRQERSSVTQGIEVDPGRECARSTTILGLFLVKTVRLLLVALPLGLAAAWVLTRWMSALLFGVGPAEPKVLIPTGLFLFGTVFLAALWPAWRCACVDPASVLRAD